MALCLLRLLRKQTTSPTTSHGRKSRSWVHFVNRDCVTAIGGQIPWIWLYREGFRIATLYLWAAVFSSRSVSQLSGLRLSRCSSVSPYVNRDNTFHRLRSSLAEYVSAHHLYMYLLTTYVCICSPLISSVFIRHNSLPELETSLLNTVTITQSILLYRPIYTRLMVLRADPNGRVSLRPFASWDFRFESHRRHGC